MPDLIPWDPWRELAEMRNAFDRFLGRRMRHMPRGPMWGMGWAPAIDAYDRGDALVIKAELPGVEKDQIGLSLLDNTLTIRGEARRDEEVRDQDYYRRERAYGSFTRSIPLPVEVDRNAVKASFKNGVLEVVLPKVKGAGPGATQIPIQ